MINLLVIGAPSMNSKPIEEVAQQVGRGDGERLFVVRCDAPSRLVSVVRGAAALLGRIDILDLFDHGAIGKLKMGDEVLFESDAVMSSRLAGWQIAKELSPYLTETARVRLLGCDTAGTHAQQGLAARASGRALLLKLAMELQEHRVVSGTINGVNKDHFSPGGFTPEFSLLFSSDAALDAEATLYEDRRAHIQDMVRPYTWKSAPNLDRPSCAERILHFVRRTLFDVVQR